MAEESDSLDFFLEKKDDDDGGDEWIRCGPWELMFRFQSADCSRAERFHLRTQSITECGFTRAESATEAGFLRLPLPEVRRGAAGTQRRAVVCKLDH